MRACPPTLWWSQPCGYHRKSLCLWKSSPQRAPTYRLANTAETLDEFVDATAHVTARCRSASGKHKRHRQQLWPQRHGNAPKSNNRSRNPTGASSESPCSPFGRRSPLEARILRSTATRERATVNSDELYYRTQFVFLRCLERERAGKLTLEHFDLVGVGFGLVDVCRYQSERGDKVRAVQQERRRVDLPFSPSARSDPLYLCSGCCCFGCRCFLGVAFVLGASFFFFGDDTGGAAAAAAFLRRLDYTT